MSEPLSTATSTIAGKPVDGFFAGMNRCVTTTGNRHHMQALRGDHVNRVELPTTTQDTRFGDDSETVTRQLSEGPDAVEYCQLVPQRIHELGTTVAIDGEYSGRKIDRTAFQIPFAHQFEPDTCTSPQAGCKTLGSVSDRKVDPGVIDEDRDTSTMTNE